MPLPRLATALCLALIALPALAEDPTARAKREAEEALIPCTFAEKQQDCELERREWLDAYQKAKAGDYQGQRNVAYMLRAGPTPPMRINPIQACAWRWVILNSGHARVDTGDTSNFQNACRPLDIAGREASQARADALLREIRASPARMPAPAPRPAPFKGPLDGTARPLSP